MGIRALLSALLLAAGLAAGAHAEPPTPAELVPNAPADRTAAPIRAAIRTGTHPGFGRVVIDLPAGVTASAGADGAGGVLVRVAGGTLGAAGAAPRNVTAIAVAGAEARLTLAPGARFAVVRLPQRVVIDVFDKAEAAAVAPAAAPVAPAATSRVAPAVAAAVAASAPPKVAPKPSRHPTRFSGPPPRRPPAALPQTGPIPAAATAAPPAPVAAMPAAATPTTVTPNTVTPAAPMPAVTVPADRAAPPFDLVPGRSEPLRVPLQSLLNGGSLPNVLRPPPPPAPPAGPPMAAPVTAVERTPLPAPGGGDAQGPAAPDAAAAKPPGPLALVAEAGAATLQLPFGPGTGAAAFRRGDEVVVVFDERRPVDLADLRGNPAAAAAFADARVQLLEAATVLRLTLPAGQGLRLSRDDDGWTLTRVAAPPPLLPIQGDVVAGAMRLTAAAPGAVVSVPDPLTGGALLVGTQRSPARACRRSAAPRISHCWRRCRASRSSRCPTPSRCGWRRPSSSAGSCSPPTTRRHRPAAWRSTRPGRRRSPRSRPRT